MKPHGFLGALAIVSAAWLLAGPALGGGCVGADIDGDGVCDDVDNCPQGANPGQGPVVFGQTVLASSKSTFSWTNAVDADYVRGPLDLVGSYTTDLSGSVSGTSFTDLSTPIPGEGSYYLVRLGGDCSMATWQSALGAERSRDTILDFALDHADGQAAAGFACFVAGYPCPTPNRIAIDRDGTQVFRHDAPTIGGEVVGQAPTTLCVDTSVQPEATYTYTLHVTCDGSMHTASLAITTRQRSFGLARATADRTWYGAGDEIVLEVDGGSDGLEVSADFSAVDSSYLTGDEIVEPLGGGIYRVRHALSSVNARPSGDYDVPVVLRRPPDAGASEAFDRGPTPIRYLPAGPPRLQFAGGPYHPEPRRSDLAVTSLLAVNAVQLVGDPTVPEATTNPPEPGPDFSPEPGPVAALYGQRVRVIASSPGPAPITTLLLEVEEVGRDGFVQIPVDAASATCVGGPSCTYTTEFFVRPKRPPAPTGESASLNWRLRAGSTVSIDLGGDFSWEAPPIPPTPPNYRVTGQLRYSRNLIIPELDQPLENSPQYYNSKYVTYQAPVARAQVRITDACDHTWDLWSDDEGGFALDFWSPCGDEPANVRVFSYREPDPRAVAVFRWIGGPIDEPEDFTDDPADYRVHGYDVTTFLPDDGPIGQGGQELAPPAISAALVIAEALYVMDNTARAVDYFKAWTEDAQYHQMNVEFDPNRTLDEDYNVYLNEIHPSLIHIHEQFGWSSFAHAHEVSHYFEERFLLGGLDFGGYGRFGEPMANAHAALIRRSPWMSNPPGWGAESLDVNGHMQGTAKFKQAEMDFCTDGGCDLSHSMGWDWRIYYDLSDRAASATPEPVTEVHAGGSALATAVPVHDDFDGGGQTSDPLDDALMEALVGYLGAEQPNPDYVDRGLWGKDLVDVLDGLVCRGQLSETDGEGLLATTMSYPYDFAPTNADCP